MKKLLVPFDFSQLSLTALKFAAGFAHITSSRIYLLHVIPRPFIYVATADTLSYSYTNIEQYKILDTHKKNAFDSLQVLMNSPEFKRLKIIPKVEIGDNVYRVILDYAEMNKIEMIIMGSKGPYSFKRRIIGTNAERILRFTDIPVLVINNKLTNLNLKNIVFPSNFENDSLHVYPLIHYIAKLYKSKVHLLHINTKKDFLPTEEMTKRFDKIKKRFDGNFKTVIRAAYEINEGIVKYSKEVKADLIALGVRRRKGPARYFTDRITEDVIRHTTLPVLAIDNPK
jgi:nucleotide-binding universal stress UspA family protein